MQSAIVVGVLFLVIAPDANSWLLAATVAYVITRSLNLYIGERARVRHQIGVYSIQQIVRAVGGICRRTDPDQDCSDNRAEWPLAGYAAAQLIAAIVVLPNIGYGRRLWPIDREIIAPCAALRHSTVIGGALGWVGLNASRFIVNDMSRRGRGRLFAVGYGLGQRAAAVAAMLVTAAAFPLA